MKRCKLTLINEDADLSLSTDEPSINRPGMALAGFFDYFPNNRIQIIGQTEISYLESNECSKNFEEICRQGSPGIIVCRDLVLPEVFLEVATRYKIPVFSSPLTTIKVINHATLFLDREFADCTSLHGCLVEIHGIGVLLTGMSGAGKSEAAIGLIERGGSLVADDYVVTTVADGHLVGRAKEDYMGFMEMRGIGVVNIANLYGSRAFMPESQIDLIVNLRGFEDLNEVDRLGMSQQTTELLGVEVVTVEIPVAPGRDTARLVDVAAMDFQLKDLGFDMAKNFRNQLHRNLKK